MSHEKKSDQELERWLREDVLGMEAAAEPVTVPQILLPRKQERVITLQQRQAA